MEFVKLKKISLIFIWSILFFGILYYFEWFGTPNISPPPSQTIDVCIGHLIKGVLYGGDPYCFQGPVVYIVAAILKFVFHSFDAGSEFLYIITLFLITYIIHKINDVETKRNPIFLIFLCIFIFGKTMLQDFTTVLLLLFLLSGFYILWYSRVMNKEIIAGILFGLAIFSKPHNAPLVVLSILLYYFFPKYWALREEEKNILMRIDLFPHDQKKEIENIIGIIIILFILFLIFFPGFIFYNYIVHTYNPVVQSYSSIFNDLITAAYWYNGLFILFVSGVLISILRLKYYNKNDVFMFVSSVCFFIIIILVANKFSLYTLSDQFRYFVPFLPFYLINLFKFADEFRNNCKKEVAIILAVYLVVLAGILYMTIGAFPLKYFAENDGINDQKLIDRMKIDIEAPILFIPPQQGKIFVYMNYSKRYAVLYGEYNPFVYVSENNFTYLYPNLDILSLDPDMAVAPNFIAAGKLDSLYPYIHLVLVNITPHTEEMKALNYSLLISGTNLPFNYLLSQVNKTTAVLDAYCTVSLPFLDEGVSQEKYLNFVWELWFLDKEDCINFRNMVKKYYVENFDHFCSYGTEAIGIIQNGVKDTVIFDKTCTSKKHLILINNSIKVQTLFYCMLLTGYLLFIFISAVKSRLKDF